jgi:cytochrome b561
MVTRYHPALVTLHWLLALLIVVMLCVGWLVLDDMSNTDPAKLNILELHMAVGMTILLLILIRALTRWRTQKPENAQTGYPLLDRLGRIVHYSFYVVVIVMALSGLSTAIVTGLNRSVFQRDGEPLPANFDDYPTFNVHSFFATVLAILIVLHIAAALYHQFIRKDRLLSRMWFGNRDA